MIGTNIVVGVHGGAAAPYYYPTVGIKKLRVWNLGQETAKVTSPSGAVLVDIPRLTTRTVDIDVSDYDYINYTTNYIFAMQILELG